MASIKESIDHLLEIFNNFGFSKLKAEDFRLAKFNESAVSSKVWRLLFETIYYLKYGNIDDVCIRAFDYFTPQEITVYVKRELQHFGFVSHDLDILLSDMTNGSRELLLAFGWLLCKETVIFHLHSTCLVPIESIPENVPNSTNGLKKVYSKSDSQNLRDGLKQMVWLNGKLRTTLKQLHGLQQEQFKLSHEIHEATNGLTLDQSRCHLSSFEIYLLKHPNLLRKNMKLLERDNERIQNLLDWRKHEDEFWHWMESVLDLKIQDTEHDENESSADSKLSSNEVQTLSDSYKRLHNALLKYENIAELLEKQWASKTLNVSQPELDLMITAVDREIDRFIRNADLNQSVETSFLQPAFSYRRPDATEGCITKQPLPNVSRDIEKEVQRLEAILSKLEDDVETNHTNFTQELRLMSHDTNSMVLFDDSV